MKTPLLELKGCSKKFPGVKALEQVHFTLQAGSVHALMGENGAGKSTLMNCLLGIHQMDEGEIYIEGEHVHAGDVREMRRRGISIIQQELSPVPDRSVMENIFINREPTRMGVFVDHKKMYNDSIALLKKYKMDIDPRARMGDLTTAKLQMVEIVKAVSWGARIVMMDEPTSALTLRETKHLFEIIQELKKEGVGIIYVTHKMDEVMQIADEVTVIRDGRWIGAHNIKDVSVGEIIAEMVGRELKDEVLVPEESEWGEVVLKVEAITGRSMFRDISFELHKGEVLGFAGLVGAGRTEVMEAIFGLRDILNGKVYVMGEEVRFKNSQDAIKAGIAFLTEDRRRDGTFGVLSIGDNIMLPNYGSYSNGIFIRKRKARSAILEQMKQFSVKAPDENTLMMTLSGGNQQKVLLCRWLLAQPDILILDEPTRGIDVGAKQEIHEIIREMASKGKSVIVVSSELPELLKVCDRIIVFSEGVQTGELQHREATQERIMEFASITNGSKG